jgi:membrane-associated phospholipid phosphatase
MEYELTPSEEDSIPVDTGDGYQTITSPGMCVPDDTLMLEDVVQCPPETLRFVFECPPVIDSWLSPFDDAIIAWVQRPLIEASALSRSAIVCFARTLSALTVVEIGFAIPLFLLLLEQFDNLAVLACYEMLLMAFLTQFPKRFCWRTRPFVDGRAIAVVLGDGPDTSSFPARAVVGATVYSLFLGIAYQMKGVKRSGSCDIPWGPTSLAVWAVTGFVVAVTMWARVLLGLHYPSCCISGAFLGVLIHLCGIVLARCHYSTCSCESDGSPVIEGVLSPGAIIGFGTPVGILIVILLERAPLTWWKKSTHALSLLLPALIFILAFRCPRLSGSASELNLEIHRHKASAATVLTALALTSIFSGLGFYTQQRSAITNSVHIQYAVFLFVTVVALLSLVATRLVEQEHEGSDEQETKIG